MKYPEQKHIRKTCWARFGGDRRSPLRRAITSATAACLVTVFALATGTSALAQERSSGVELSDEQRQQIRELMLQERADARESREVLRGEIAALLTDEQREQILDRAIKARFEGRRGVDVRKSRAGVRGRDGRMDRQFSRADARMRRTDGRVAIRQRRAIAQRAQRATASRYAPQRMLQSLALNDDQRAKVAEILQSERDAFAEWREQNLDADRTQRDAFMDERRTATLAAIREVLSDEQKARFDEQSQRRERRPSPRSGR